MCLLERNRMPQNRVISQEQKTITILDHFMRHFKLYITGSHKYFCGLDFDGKDSDGMFIIIKTFIQWVVL